MFNVIILGLTSFFTDIASEMVYPLIPFFLTSVLGASPAVLGLIEGVAESTASLLKVFSGYISDKFRNRKVPAIVGYSSSAVGKLLLYIANSWGFVFAGRIVDRLGKGIRTAPRDALIADSIDPAKKGTAFGLHRAMDTTGAAIGVVLAYFFLTSYSGEYSRVFLWSLVPALIGIILLFMVREKKAETASRKPPSLKWRILPRKLQLFLIVAFIFTLGNSSNTFLLLRSKDIGFTPATAILLYLVYNIIYGLVSYPAGKLSDRIGRKQLLVAGYVFYGLVYLGFAFVSGPQHAWLLWVLFGVYGLYSGFTEGVEKALVADLAPSEVRATAIGLHATILGIGLFPASFLAGELWQQIGPSAAFYFGGGMGIIAAIGLFFVL
ncbi:MAG: MFS transporter [Bacteroidetes bacterium]|nr:MFS transporter [Bacteroidota bacterium]MCL5266647.1 MFS transporter [Bacteroidota bacterium]